MFRQARARYHLPISEFGLRYRRKHSINYEEHLEQFEKDAEIMAEHVQNYRKHAPLPTLFEGEGFLKKVRKIKNATSVR